MCNPRRVMIHLKRQIEEAWNRTMEQRVELTSEVNEMVSINAEVRLDEEMGEIALQMLEGVLSGKFPGFEPWDRDDYGRYHRNLDQVILIFDPKTKRLSIQSELMQTVSAGATGYSQCSGITKGEVTAEAEAIYYEDGWRNMTEEKAHKQASKLAEENISIAAEKLHQEQNKEEFQKAVDRAKQDAEAKASQELASLADKKRTEIREKLCQTLDRSKRRVFNIMNRAVGEAYRQTLLKIVKENSGRVISDQQTGSVINMELELVI